MRDSAGMALYAGAVKTSSGSASSSASSAVISFVVLAIDRSWSGRFANMTVPSRASTTIAAAAVGTRGAAAPPRPGAAATGTTAASTAAADEHSAARGHSRSLIFWPATSPCGSSSGFSSSRRSTVVPFCSAMPLSVSFALIVYVLGVRFCFFLRGRLGRGGQVAGARGLRGSVVADHARPEHDRRDGHGEANQRQRRQQARELDRP